MRDRRDIEFGKEMEGRQVWIAFRIQMMEMLATALPESFKAALSIEEARI